MNILFVCSGNTCRSPMAAYLADDIAKKQFPGCGFRFDSAGIATSDGYPATDHAVEALAELGIALETEESAVAVLTKEGFDPKNGARPLSRVIRTRVEDALAEELLSGRLHAGDKAVIAVEEEKIVVRGFVPTLT